MVSRTVFFLNLDPLKEPVQNANSEHWDILILFFNFVTLYEFETTSRRKIFVWIQLRELANGGYFARKDLIFD